MYRRLKRPVSGSRIDCPRSVSRSRTFASASANCSATVTARRTRDSPRPPSTGGPGGTASVKSPSVSPCAASGTHTKADGVRRAEVEARRARRHVVDPVDPAAAERPAVVELEALAPARERRAPDGDRPQAVARGRRDQHRARRVREEPAAELAHHAVRLVGRRAGLEELAQLPEELDLARALRDQRVDAARERVSRLTLPAHHRAQAGRHPVQPAREGADLVGARHLGPRLEVALGQPAGRGGDQLDPAEDDPLAAEPDGGDRHAPRRAPGRGGSRRARGRPRQRRRCAATRRSGRRAAPPDGAGTGAKPRSRTTPSAPTTSAVPSPFSATVAVTTGASGRGWPTHRHGSGCRARIVPRSSERATAQSTGRSAAANRPTQPRSSAANTTNCVPPPEYGIGSAATSCGLPVTGSISWSPRRERLGAHGAIEPRPVHHVHGPRERHGAADDLAARRGDAERGHVGKFPQQSPVPDAAGRRVARAGLGLRRQGHQEPARLADALLVRPDETPREAERGVAPVPGRLPALRAVQEEHEAKGRKGGQDNEGHQAVSEAREARGRHVSPPDLSFLYHESRPEYNLASLEYAARVSTRHISPWM